MLKIRVLSIGKDKDRWLSDGCDHYVKLLSRYARVEIKLVPSLKSGASLPSENIKAREAERLLAACSSNYLVALYDGGEKFDSPGFARRLEQLQTDSGGGVTFVIGGAFGLHQSVLDKADFQFSLSALTLSHQLARLVLLEQLYRGFSIIHGTAYHK